MADITLEQFDDTPAGNARRWSMEFESAKKEVKQWHLDAANIIKRFKADFGGASNGDDRLNLFTANIQTMRALLFGKVPNVDVSRRFADYGDHTARVSSEMLQRLLNMDVEEGHDSYASTLEHCLDDRLLAGAGIAKCRYEIELEKTEVEAQKHPETGEQLAAAYTHEEITDENVEVDYYHYSDVLWSPCRTFDDMRWMAFRAEMSRKELVERFGEEVGKKLPLNTKNRQDRGAPNDPLSRADVWEIWDKENKKVYWYVEGYPSTVDEKEDPLNLEHFWPFPRPMFANLTNSKLLPVPDFMLAKGIYDEIDSVSQRIATLSRSAKVAGVYDKTAYGVGRLLNETTDNTLIPIENWSLFAQQGGLKGVIDWMPMDQIVAGLDKLREYRTELVNLLYQVTGMSDIMRGQAQQNTTATEQAIKAKFASVRVQSLQDEFARFATDIQKIKAEIISKHFRPETIIERSNVMFTPDAQMAAEAVQLIKSHFFLYRIEVKPESISLTDYAALKQERTEYLQALSGFLNMAAPVAQQLPGSMPFLLELLQWGLAGFRGASTIEGVLDQAISMAQKAEQMKAMQPPQAPPPDPKVMAVQAKAQGDIQKTQVELKADLLRQQANVQAENQKNASNAHWNVVQAEGTARAKALASIDAITRPNPGGTP